MMRRAILAVVTMALTLLAASGVALAVIKIGTDGPDTLRGTNGADQLVGKGGNDVLFALGGRDNLLGQDGKDWVLGRNEERPLGGDKNLAGGDGNDGVLGGEGPDILLGASGNDFADGASGSDNILGGDGNDVIDLINRPAKRDLVTCGAGFDRVLTDRADVVAPDCEKVAVGLAAALRLNHRIEESGFYDRIFEGLAPFPGG